MKYRLHVGAHKHVDLEKLPTSMIWYQVIDVKGLAGVEKGDMIRNVMRGWEVYYRLEDPTPRAVFPRRCHIERLGDEEE
tara:strand:+ start:205 stop:441 length:237 start_codon:yes stop_codon:yes gene_type:complete